jgi:phosphoglycerate kinase
MKSVRQIKKLSGKKVLVRVDFNTPVKNGKVASDYKLVKSIPTIDFLLKGGATVILVSHLGRQTGPYQKLSLKQIAKRLEDLMQKKVVFLQLNKNSDWKKIQEQIAKFPKGTLALLENIRFVPEEEKEGTNLSKALAALCDVFVLDGFAVSHRKASSVSGVAKYVPAFAGLLLFEEITVLSKVIKKPKRPLVVMLGGAKAETKIPILKKFLPIADHILVGGGIFNTYLSAKGKFVGKSLVSPDFEKDVKRYCASKKIILPVDVVVGDPKGKNVRVEKVDKLKVGKNEAIYDVGPETVRNFAEYIRKGKTLVWNGALGMFEQSPYHHGTFSLVRLFAARSKGKAVGVSGGGETVEILEKLHAMSELDLVSTGGGAMLEFFSGTKLPGLKNLD